MSEICYTDLVEGCDQAFEATANDCNDFEIAGSIAPGDYYLICVTPKGNRYWAAITVGGSGAVPISVDGFPDGLFNQYAGQFVFYVSIDYVDPVPVTMTISGTEYDYLLIDWTVTCCGSGYTPPTTCEKFLAGLSASEIDCIQASDICLGVNSKQTIIIFDATASSDISTFTADLNTAGTYTTDSSSNVTSYSVTVNNVAASLPITIANGDTVTVSITRTNQLLDAFIELIE